MSAVGIFSIYIFFVAPYPSAIEAPLGMSIMSERYTVRTVVFASGERFPILVRVSSGVPLFDPTVFTLSQIRARNRASGTIEVVLRALMVLQLFCDQHQIDLTDRMRAGQLLEMGELDALVRLCRLPMSAIVARGDRNITTGHRRAPVTLEGYRARATNGIEEVASDFAGVRIRYIRNFIEWLTDRLLLSMDVQHPTRATLLDAKKLVVSGLTARISSAKGRNNARSRRALDELAQERLWNVIEVRSTQNPWEGRHAKVRNELIVRWFMGLGIRRGELLGVKIGDVNIRTGEVFIARRADDSGDPRRCQPNTKTHDRTLPINNDLAQRTLKYIVEERRRYPAARKHPFLFVANGGAPLSLRGLNEIFIALRQMPSDLPAIYPHILRHTNNYNFSKLSDEQGMDPEVEKKIRSQMMGWSETSGTAERYTRRETERKARDASLQLQDRMVKPINEQQ
ncbi:MULTISPECIES: tyrosine-type recombinase/integrase [Burkholderia cepacia complex]|uniref:tyrosine-type recombinase/integrase n=1 Tax=Burkholderia cepacia complex TaxID=87882 RepID=UPI000CFFBAD4|nr:MULTISPECIES: site-specific integrase [Burkholderia cepacia complex]MBR8304697.1 site-specific integrase [Burkholderia dolosa]MDN8051297.1 site-specific integrase [Burkholderia multivorans]PRH27393.1 integrase [Burkholderia multivorans]